MSSAPRTRSTTGWRGASPKPWQKSNYSAALPVYPLSDRTGIVEMKLIYQIALVGLAALIALPASAQGRKPKAAPAEKQEQSGAADDKKIDKEFPTKATWNLKEINGKPPAGEAS